jgi:hypothetical protein
MLLGMEGLQRAQVPARAAAGSAATGIERNTGPVVPKADGLSGRCMLLSLQSPMLSGMPEEHTPRLCRQRLHQGRRSL